MQTSRLCQQKEHAAASIAYSQYHSITIFRENRGFIHIIAGTLFNNYMPRWIRQIQQSVMECDDTYWQCCVNLQVNNSITRRFACMTPCYVFYGNQCHPIHEVYLHNLLDITVKINSWSSGITLYMCFHKNVPSFLEKRTS